ncbi:hypothetical protein ALP36_200102 [Pseudomonas syringae pv. coriandricola]|uniref:Uncharacterized protein n=1 Tax=Pseudomonas syringae pv. coriandricola TaxID=264453 RepID=A0A3M5RAQ9_9PSED|nr:hypothetical protein ALP36_200102 [Pseudomonas syringae pv. coriandricola]
MKNSHVPPFVGIESVMNNSHAIHLRMVCSGQLTTTPAHRYVHPPRNLRFYMVYTIIKLIQLFFTPQK